METERFFQNLIVLEEFLKELMAIAETKTRLYALAKLARIEEESQQQQQQEERIQTIQQNKTKNKIESNIEAPELTLTNVSPFRTESESTIQPVQ